MLRFSSTNEIINCSFFGNKYLRMGSCGPGRPVATRNNQNCSLWHYKLTAIKKQILTQLNMRKTHSTAFMLVEFLLYQYGFSPFYNDCGRFANNPVGHSPSIC